MTAPNRTERGFERLLFFSDAVVAIAISLLILPLVDVVSDESIGVGDLVQEDWGRLLAFALSFVVIAQFWFIHHQLFESISGYTTAMVWVNMLWLASIVFLPLPTEMVGGSQGSRAVYGLYIGAMLVTSASLSVLRHLAITTPDVQRVPMRREGFLTTACLALALVIAVAVPRIGLWSLTLLLAIGFVQRRLNRRES